MMLIWKRNANDFSHYATCLFLLALYFTTESFRKPVSSAALWMLNIYYLENKHYISQDRETLNKTQVLLCCRGGNVCVLSEWLCCLIKLISYAADIVFALVKTVCIDQPLLLLSWQMEFLPVARFGLSLCFFYACLFCEESAAGTIQNKRGQYFTTQHLVIVGKHTGWLLYMCRE